MKRFYFISAVILFAFAANFFLPATYSHSNIAGAPAGYTGSPGDGQTCNKSGCHTGVTPITTTGWITSTIPAAGYTPGTTYTITATATRPGHSRIGFEVSPQTSSGAFRGTLINTSTQTQLVGASRYITHKSTGVTASGGVKTWTFNWTAPATGLGPVTFYGAFNATNANNNTAGDTIIKSTLIVSEILAGVADNTFSEKNILVYPTLVDDQLTISYKLDTPVQISLQVFDISGKLMETILSNELQSGEQNIIVDCSGLASGSYFVTLFSEKEKHVQKVIVSR